MPGYTHLQKAMPSTVGMWALAFVESLLDDSKSVSYAYELNDQCPLGSAAAYGVPLGLDREYSAKLLGFSKVQVNPIYCQNSRGKIEAEVVASLIQVLATINRFASDILLFTTSEFNLFNISESLCSGSSIMPQKKNVDVAELLKSKVHLVLGFYTQLISLSNNLASGYNRDLQDSKKPLMESFEITLDSLKVASILINNLTPNENKLKNSMTPEIFATHRAFELVKKGMSFREAYQKIGKNIHGDKTFDFDKLLKLSTHIGGTANLGFGLFEKEITLEKNIFEKEKNIFETSIKKLINDGGKNK
jgi:argininosuccinate lyase